VDGRTGDAKIPGDLTIALAHQERMGNADRAPGNDRRAGHILSVEI
jgi:hypothetical protein